jgi:MFS superfamily sulfate permease-like transporter
MNAGVTSLTAVMAKTDLGGEAYVAEYGEEAYVLLVSAYSLYIGVASIVMALIGFGNLAQKAPTAVKTGFKWGCELGVLTSALPNGLYEYGSTLKYNAASSVFGEIVKSVREVSPNATGVSGVCDMLYAVSHPQTWDLVAALIFLSCTIIVMKGKAYLHKSLPPGSEVVLATAAATVFSVYYGYTGGVVGEIPTAGFDAGLSFFNGMIKVPIESLDIKELLNVPIAKRCFGDSMIKLFISASIFSAINFLSVVGIASGFEADNSVPWSAPRELFAQGVSNIAAGAVGSAPVSGSMSRSLVSRMTGASSKLACIVTSLLWMYMMPFMSVLSPTPKAALSSVIVSAVVENVVVPKKLLALKGADFIVGVGTAAGTAITNPTLGFGFGMVLHILTSIVAGKVSKKKVA